MTQSGQALSCPACGAGIPFDARQMLRGARFACHGCGAEIGLSAESRGVVEKALAAFEEQRRRLNPPSTERP